jgi:hypothetical protein
MMKDLPSITGLSIPESLVVEDGITDGIIDLQVRMARCSP